MYEPVITVNILNVLTGYNTVNILNVWTGYNTVNNTEPTGKEKSSI